MTRCHLELKPGVRLHGLCSQMVLATEIVREYWEELDVDTLVVTVGMDGSHVAHSAHYRGEALDFRTHNLAASIGRDTVVHELQRRLGADYFMQIEDVGQPNEHLHIEWRPETPYTKDGA